MRFSFSQRHLPTISFLLLFLTVCGRIQTRPSCEVGGYGVITFHNDSDEFKAVLLHRVVQTRDGYKKVGEPREWSLRPLVVATRRVKPGVVLVEIRFIDGKVWMKLLEFEVCDNNTISMRNPVLSDRFDLRNLFLGVPLAY